MNLEAVRLFVDVVKSGSFAAVARHRNIDPSSVSRSISGLEARLGFRLLQRSTRKLAPTEAGSEYFARVQSLVAEFDRAGEQARDLISEPISTLRVTACTSFGQRVLAPLLPKLRDKYPKLTIDLVLVDHQVDLVEEQIDVAIRFGGRPAGEFVAERLVDRRFRVCASPAYVRIFGEPAHPDELANRDCLLFPFPGYRSCWIFRKPGEREFQVAVSGHLFVSHGMTMTSCAVAGLGPALLPDWLCADEIEAGDLVDLFPGYEVAATGFDTAAWLVYPRHDYLPAKLRAFVAFLKTEVRGFA